MIKPQSHQPRDQSVILTATGHKRKMYITQPASEPLWDCFGHQCIAVVMIVCPQTLICYSLSEHETVKTATQTRNGEHLPPTPTKTGQKVTISYLQGIFSSFNTAQLAVNVCRKVQIFYANKRYLQKSNNDQSNHKECFFMCTLFATVFIQ